MDVFFVSSALAGFGLDALPAWLSWMAPAPEPVQAPAPPPLPPPVEIPPSRLDPAYQPPLMGITQGCGTADATPARWVEEDRSPKAVLKATIRRKTGQIKYCYEEALKEDPTLEGRVAMFWRLEGGRPHDVRTDSTLNPALIDCITHKIERWRFPVEVEDGDVSWPFVFRPQR